MLSASDDKIQDALMRAVAAEPVVVEKVVEKPVVVERVVEKTVYIRKRNSKAGIRSGCFIL
jgi:hypothetical protein